MMENRTIDEKKLDELMLKLGHSENLLGTDYLRTAVRLRAQGFSAMTKEIYPTLARMHNTTASRAERAIRHSIERAAGRTDPEELYKVFGNSISPDKGKPTNSEYIARLARVCGED